MGNYLIMEFRTLFCSLRHRFTWHDIYKCCNISTAIKIVSKYSLKASIVKVYRIVDFLILRSKYSKNLNKSRKHFGIKLHAIKNSVFNKKATYARFYDSKKKDAFEKNSTKIYRKSNLF